MAKLTNLVKEYRRTKNNKILEDILILIKKDIAKRVELIYKKLKYYQIDKKDIEQELYIKILKTIKNYNEKLPFENYLFYSLKLWQPKLKKEDLIHYESLYKTDETTGEDLEIEIEDNKQNNSNSKIVLEEILKECKTDIEKKICISYLENPKITEEELAQKLGTYQKHISRIINGLRKRLKKFV